MSYFELFQKGPLVFIPILLLLLVITVVAYGAFPIIFAKTRKTAIVSKKFTFICYTFNFGVMFLFFIFNSSSSPAPYLLWTSIFAAAGRSILRDKYLLTTSREEICPRCKARLNLEKDGSWRCLICGYVSNTHNKCSQTIHELDQKVAYSSTSASNWRCSCGRNHPRYVSACVCGKNKSEFVSRPSPTKTIEHNPPIFPATTDKICFCRKCGTKLVDGASFCGKCGTKIIQENQQ